MAATITKPRKRSASVPRPNSTVKPETYSAAIAIRIRELRLARGLTVEDLAEKIGVSVQSMYAYENHTRVMQPDQYYKLAKAFGVTKVADLLPDFTAVKPESKQ
jgi:transcriptional regulator with XRE-family HTH domain